jgi:hypothetical protein
VIFMCIVQFELGLIFLQCENIVKSEPIRYHHVVSDTCRNYVRRIQYRKSFITCSRGNQRDMLGIAVARSVSTVVDHVGHDATSKISESSGSNLRSVVSESLKSSPVTSEVATQSSVAPSPESIPEPPPVPPEVVSSSVHKTVTPLGNIPEPPAIPPEIDLVEALPLSGEPPFASIGLGGWSPVGIVQNCMEYLHVGCDLPWWMSIVIGNTE